LGHFSHEKKSFETIFLAKLDSPVKEILEPKKKEKVVLYKKISKRNYETKTQLS
jgi:hypothetical protein